MEVSETKLTPPDEFPFPFTPYSIQEDLMRRLYETLEEKKLGVFESPTGTGKSMSLICGSLKWLFDAQQRLKSDVTSGIKKLDEELKNTTLGTNWLDEHALQARSKQKRDGLHSFLKKMTAWENRIEEMKEKAKSVGKAKRTPGNGLGVSNESKWEDEQDVLLDDYCSSEGVDGKSSESEAEAEAEEKEQYHGIKVYLCSRTHSQLSQLAQEVRKSPFNDLGVRVVTLASRQNYCVNESVVKLKYLPLMNEKCQELHEKKRGKATRTAVNGQPMKRQKTTGGCPFYQQANMERVRLKVMSEVMDVEQLVQWGKEASGCPYYASRHGVDEAQLILVPYNTILHRSTRLACNIDLKNSVVIIDEAHNLLDTIGSIHSCTVTGLQLAQSLSLLTEYKEKYSERFSAVNLLRLNQLIFVVKRLLRRVGGRGSGQGDSLPAAEAGAGLETIPEFLLSCEIDTINFFSLMEFVSKSRLLNKLKGFVQRRGPSVGIHERERERGVSAFLKVLTGKGETGLEEETSEENERTCGNAVMSVVGFVEALTNHCLDGRIVCSRSPTAGSSSLKYLLLNPASHFSDIVREARSVVLAGGTMQPVSEFTEQLFHLAGGAPDRISVFSCGHIIPESNILPVMLSKGPSGRVLDFSFQQRGSADLQDELGRLLLNVCNVVPAGVVCFFPSYEYEAAVYGRLSQTGVIGKVLKKKKVLREPRASKKVEDVLREYKSAVEGGGALLLSVVGGKLSEGLNFSDDLGRCVMVVGLPYANSGSVELKEKMKYLDAEVGPGAGQAYYENLCMKAVNQSIGRSIRHRNDYASVLLVDRRYSRPQCARALPQWIQKSLRKEETFGPVIGLLARFFAAKRQQK